MLDSLEAISKHLAPCLLIEPSDTDIPEHIPLRDSMIKRLLDENVAEKMIRFVPSSQWCEGDDEQCILKG